MTDQISTQTRLCVMRTVTFLQEQRSPFCAQVFGVGWNHVDGISVGELSELLGRGIWPEDIRPENRYLRQMGLARYVTAGEHRGRWVYGPLECPETADDPKAGVWGSVSGLRAAQARMGKRVS